MQPCGPSRQSFLRWRHKRRCCSSPTSRCYLVLLACILLAATEMKLLWGLASLADLEGSAQQRVAMDQTIKHSVALPSLQASCLSQGWVTRRSCLLLIVQVPGTDDDIGYEAARVLAGATGDGKPLLAQVLWRSRAIPGNQYCRTYREHITS